MYINGFCPNCEKEEHLQVIQQEDILDIKGENIPVSSKILKCMKCAVEFNDPEDENDILETAYRTYRDRTGLLQPEEIRGIREKYGLTQEEFSLISGIGIASLSRYENGSLQSSANDNLIRAFDYIDFILNTISKVIKTSSVSPETLAKFNRISDEFRLLKLFKDLDTCQNYPDELSGNKRFDPKKWVNLILYLLNENRGLFKTKLYKLLFYCDFVHFKRYAQSITGCVYAHATYGFLPDKIDTLISILATAGLIREVEVNDFHEKIQPMDDPNMLIFTTPEIETIQFVNHFFTQMSAKEISDYSHEEPLFRESANGGLILYNLADSLSLE